MCAKKWQIDWMYNDKCLDQKEIQHLTVLLKCAHDVCGLWKRMQHKNWDSEEFFFYIYLKNCIWKIYIKRIGNE